MTNFENLPYFVRKNKEQPWRSMALAAYYAEKNTKVNFKDTILLLEANV